MLLMEAGANFHARTDVSKNEFIFLCIIAHELAGNDIWQHGQTPLHRACYKGHTETAIMLMEAGADAEVKDKVYIIKH